MTKDDKIDEIDWLLSVVIPGRRRRTEVTESLDLLGIEWKTGSFVRKTSDISEDLMTMRRGLADG